MTATKVLGFIDVFCGLILLWAALRITTASGFHTTQARWAFVRRLIYGSTAIALFALGIGRIDGRYLVEETEMIFQVMLLVGIVSFPLLRAYGWITQDQFKNVSGFSQDRRKIPMS